MRKLESSAALHTLSIAATNQGYMTPLWGTKQLETACAALVEGFKALCRRRMVAMHRGGHQSVKLLLEATCAAV